jgi:hypothetical protein
MSLRGSGKGCADGGRRHNQRRCQRRQTAGKTLHFHFRHSQIAPHRRKLRRRQGCGRRRAAFHMFNG